jgi:mannosyl-oligosaccharide glucosidase
MTFLCVALLCLLSVLVATIEGQSEADIARATLSAAQNASLLWGTYRPNLYFGTRTRSPTNAILTGLLWHGAKDFEGDAWQRRISVHSGARV